jgi:hypothetical protein
MSDLAGKTVGGYPIEKSLGNSGHVEFLEARTSGDSLLVRVLREELRSDSILCRQVARNWEAVRAIQNPSLQTLFTVGQEAEIGVFGLEEKVVGKSLRESVLGGSKVAWRDCSILAEQLLGALAALHAASRLHGCVWTGDILVTQDQDLKLGGAGLLTKVERPLIEIVPGPASGYLSPETLSGSPPTVENDIYGAGGCLYFVLSGRDPFPGEDTEAIRQQALEKRPPPISAVRDDIPPEVEEFIQRLMAKEPTQRYGSVAAALADLKNLTQKKPLGALVGGKPAPPPRPVGAGTGVMPKARSGVQTSVSSGNSGAGIRPAKALGASTGTLQAIKGHAGKVFGRLETHVKSTIPQSQTERKGDDYYRQGQLPLALSNWREAFESEVPHAALKIKIELAEKELKREAFETALEEARIRLGDGEYSAAISRAREALLSAETEQQRHEAMRLETDAGRQAVEARKSTTIKLIGVTIGLIIGIILVFLIIRPSGKKQVEDETPIPTVENPNQSPPNPNQVNVKMAGASFIRAPNWIPASDGQSMSFTAENGEIIQMTVVKHSPNTNFEAKRDEVKKGGGLIEPQPLGDQDVFAFLDRIYLCSEAAFKYTQNEQSFIRFFFVVQGPNDSVYQVEFYGPENVFDLGMQAQVREMMLTWSYKK